MKQSQKQQETTKKLQEKAKKLDPKLKAQAQEKIKHLGKDFKK